MKSVLVLCTGNSCRSILAEAMINAMGQGQYQAVSAGSCPTGYVHPLALEILGSHNIKAPDARSKSWDEFTGQPFDLVITVCDQAASEACPLFHGDYRKLHWSTPDPAAVQGDADTIRAAFETAYTGLRKRIEMELL